MQHRHKNNLGLWGWLGGGRYGADRYAYTLHRLTGLGILAYFLMHIFVTGTRVNGPEAWDSAMRFFSHPLFHLGEFLVYLAFIYHAINGVRLVLVELGLLVGKPGLPSYPYSHSVLRQKPVLVTAMVLTAILVIFAGADFFFLSK